MCVIIINGLGLFLTACPAKQKGSTMLEELKMMMKEMAQDQELHRIIARGYMNRYKTLIEEGFTEAQAIQIVSSQGMGMSKN